MKTAIEERKKLLRALLQQGFGSLNHAQRSPENAPALLKKACSAFMEAMRLDRGAPEGFVGMAYLLWLVGDHAEATSYLQEALILDPHYRDAQTLLAVIHPATQTTADGRATVAARQHPPQRQRRPRHPHEGSTFRAGDSPLPTPLAQAEVLDYDRLYDQIESAIQKEVRQLSAFGPEWYESSGNRLRVEKTEQRYIQLRAKYARIRAGITKVEEEIDCAPLHEMLSTLDIFVARCEYQLQLSWQLIELQEMLKGHLDWINAALKRREQTGRLAADFSAKRFDYLLSDCDQLADQLDQLEQQGINTERLVTTYEQLAHQIARFQQLQEGA
ncbi:MAG: hypothetical protein ACO1RX_22840 [Candidatus Sericytochromatia bacterium]